MTVFVREDSWKWLSQSAGAEDVDLLDKVKAFLTRDFEQAFEIIRSQKLLSRSRSLEATTSICAELVTWAKTAPLRSKEQSKLIRHCRLTIGLQSMMSSVRARTEGLDIWNLCFTDLAPILISSLEATNAALNQRSQERAMASRDADVLELNATRHWMFRGMLDSAQPVLNEGRRRCADSSDYKAGNPTAFVESLRLAQETTEIMLVWDHYSFARAQLSVTGSEIRIIRPDAHTAVRLGNYRQRMMELDLTHRGSAHQRFSVLSEKLKKDVSAAEFSVSLDDFLGSLAGIRIVEQLLEITKVQEKDTSDALETLIDLDAEVKLGRLKHVYRDLVTVWCYIVRVAVVSRLWGELVQSATGEYPNAMVTMKRLQGTFIGLRELPESAIDKGIRHFSSSIDQKHIDLFYEPILRMTDEEVLIPASYILNSRFDRNLIGVVAREKSDSLAVKGRKPLRKLRTLFEESGFRCIEDIEIRNSRGNLLTDLDLLAYRANDVFLYQSKVLSIPDTPYEYWRVDQTLLSAALQMDVVLNHTSQVERACQSEDPAFQLNDKRVSAYLITDVMVHSGFTLNGYEVVDFAYLQHLLRGAHLGVHDVVRQEVIATFSEIEGDSPTPDEIRGLISALSSPKSRPLTGSPERRIELGGWTLIMDARGPV